LVHSNLRVDRWGRCKIFQLFTSDENITGQEFLLPSDVVGNRTLLKKSTPKQHPLTIAPPSQSASRLLCVVSPPAPPPLAQALHQPAPSPRTPHQSALSPRTPHQSALSPRTPLCRRPQRHQIHVRPLLPWTRSFLYCFVLLCVCLFWLLAMVVETSEEGLKICDNYFASCGDFNPQKS